MTIMLARNGKAIEHARAGGRWLTGSVAALAVMVPAGALQAQTTGDDAPGIARSIAQTVAQSAALVQFDIPAQPLTDALTLFGRQSGWQVSVHGDLLTGLSGQPVSGAMSPTDAMARLLTGTGLTFTISGGRTVVVQKATQLGQVDPNVVQIGPVRVESQGASAETALGPVKGYIASRSATGTKTDASLLDTPQSISVVTRDQIETQNAQTVPQTLRYTAGIEPESRGTLAGSADIIFGRGFIMDRYLNGLRLEGASGFVTPQIDVFNLERVEVLRGPASVLYGAASPGGMVNLVGKMPTTTPRYEAFLQGGNYNSFAAGIDVGGPVPGSDTLFYRLVGVARTADTQVDFNKSQRLSISPSVTWRPDTDTSVTVMLSYQHDPYVGLYNFIPAAGSVLPNPNGNIPRNFFAGDPNFNQYSRDQFSVGYLAERRLSSTFTVRQNFRYMTANGQLSQVLGAALAPNGRTLFRYNASDTEYLTTVSVDTQLEASVPTGPLQHRLLAGIDFRWNNFTQRLGLGFNVPSIDIYAPVYGVQVGPTNLVTSAQQTENQLGLYLQDQIRFDRLSLVLGLRQDWANAATTNQLVNTTATQADAKLSGRAGLVYAFDSGVAPYLSYSTSFQPTIGVTATGAPFKPTTGEQIEAGIKFQPAGGKSFAMASVYQITQQNVLTADPANALFQIQTGAVRSRGVELSSLLVPTEGLNVMWAFSYNDPKITASNNRDIGNMPAFVPNVTASLWSDYTIQSGALYGFKLGGGVRHIGFTYSTSANTLQIPAYTLLDAMVSYDLGGLMPKLGGFVAAVNATNLLDTRYVSECSSATNCLYGQGASVLANLRKVF
ncbi:TonB-dependent siderophore receptor [Reyranella sp.]|uniref:TonB-dependent siderophore receptor n=1 Tax=Reyranella sp. TaxID=1929291 RepID=UPI003D0F3DB1